MNIEEMRVSLKTILPDSEVDELTDEEVESTFFDHFPLDEANGLDKKGSETKADKNGIEA